jgi:integrase
MCVHSASTGVAAGALAGLRLGMPKITKRVVDAIRTPASGELYVWDTELKGFGVRKMPSGVAAFLIRYRNGRGRDRKMVLGRVGVLTPDEARALARDRLADVAHGQDPSVDRKTDKAAMDVRALCELYLSKAAKGLILGKGGRPKKPSTLSRDISNINRHILPLLGNRIVADLRSSDIQDFMDDIVDGRTALVEKSFKLRGKSIVSGGRGAAARTVGLLGGIMTFARKSGIIEQNPVTGVHRPADQKNEVRLKPDDYARLGTILARIEASGVSRGAAVIRMIALTGARRGEIESLSRKAIEEAEQRMTLVDSKENRSVRPIGKVAMQIASLQPQVAGCPYVFPGEKGESHYKGVCGVWNRIKKDVTDEKITLHTLRHSFASVAGDLGYRESTIAGLIGHAAGSVTGRYVHPLDEVLIRAVNKVSATIARYMSSPSTPIPPGARKPAQSQE